MTETTNTPIDSFEQALITMQNIMNTEKERREALGESPTEEELIDFLDKKLETYEDKNIRPIPKFKSFH